MRWNRIKLYSIAAPLALLPVLDISFSQVGPYLKGMEFRVFLAEIITQVISGVVDAAIITGISSVFAAF